MGFLDSIAGQVLGSLSGNGDRQHPGLVDAIGGLLNNPQIGGLSGLIAIFEKQGLGKIIASWVGTGQNLPISVEQLQAVLGNEQVQAIAQKLGLTPQAAVLKLTELLPQVIDKITPNGVVPQGDVVSGLLAMFKGAAR